MGRKRRGYGWSRKKGFSKKHRQDEKVVNSVEKTQNSVQSPSPTPVQHPSPNFVKFPSSPEEWRLYSLIRRGGHTPQCYFLGIRRGCMKCWDEYNNSVGPSFLSRGEFD
jgi:hypothetical protein